MPDDVAPRRACLRVFWSELLCGWRVDCRCLWACTYLTHRVALHAATQHLAHAQRTNQC